MARRVKQVWADLVGGGTPTSAARFNDMESAIFNVDYRAAARAFHNAAQSSTSGVDLVLALNSERYDTENNAASTIHDNVSSNSRLTCRTAGIYSIVGSVEWVGSAVGVRVLKIRLNGTTMIAQNWSTSNTSAAFSMTISTDYQLSVNDYVELLALQNSGGALNVNSTSNYSPEFMMKLVA